MLTYNKNHIENICPFINHTFYWYAIDHYLFLLLILSLPKEAWIRGFNISGMSACLHILVLCTHTEDSLGRFGFFSHHIDTNILNYVCCGKYHQGSLNVLICSTIQLANQQTNKSANK